jgi:predicted Fe-Mo cluster-binding NifX family protein
VLIAVTSMEKSIDSQLSRRFGWSNYIFVADTESRVVKIIDNRPNSARPLGAGARTAEILSRLGVRWVATGEIGRESFDILHNSGVKVVTQGKGTCREILDRLAAGGLRAAESPTGSPECGIDSAD